MHKHIIFYIYNNIYVYMYTYVYIYICIYTRIFYISFFTNSQPPSKTQTFLQDIELNELQAFRADYMKFRAGQVRRVGVVPVGRRWLQGEVLKIRLFVIWLMDG